MSTGGRRVGIGQEIDERGRIRERRKEEKEEGEREMDAVG